MSKLVCFVGNAYLFLFSHYSDVIKAKVMHVKAKAREPQGLITSGLRPKPHNAKTSGENQKLTTRYNSCHIFFQKQWQ